MLNPRPDSSIQRLLLETKYVRILGRKIFPCYTTTLDDGTRVALRVDGSDPGVFREIFDIKPYEKYLKLELGDVVADVGANIGCFSLRASRLVGRSGRVLAFEPSRSNFRVLQRNIQINGLRNVTPFRFALGAVRDMVELNIYDYEDGDTILASRGVDRKRRIRGKENVTVRTLDDVDNELNIGNIDFIKVDTEGFELPTLKGASKVIRECHPKIVGEAHPEFSDSAESIIQYLKGFGYQGVVENQSKQIQFFYAWVT